jgi:hypothetical protein
MIATQTRYQSVNMPKSDNNMKIYHLLLFLLTARVTKPSSVGRLFCPFFNTPKGGGY